MFTDGKIWCQNINYTLLACYSWKQNWKIASATDFMAFLVKACFGLFDGTSAQKMMISAFWATSWQFFSNFLKCQISDQLDHSNRNYRIAPHLPPPPPPLGIPICKKPGLFSVKNFDYRYCLLTTWIKHCLNKVRAFEPAPFSAGRIVLSSCQPATILSLSLTVIFYSI